MQSPGAPPLGRTLTVGTGLAAGAGFILLGAPLLGWVLIGLLVGGLLLAPARTGLRAARAALPPSITEAPATPGVAVMRRAAPACADGPAEADTSSSDGAITIAAPTAHHLAPIPTCLGTLRTSGGARRPVPGVLRFRTPEPQAQ